MTSLRLVFAALLVVPLTGCGERAPHRDPACGGKSAYTKKPLFASCERLRTNESVIDTKTGVRKDHVHRVLYCC